METLLNQEYRQKMFGPLIEQIKCRNTEYSKFKVFDYEASLGKTYNYCKALVDNYNSESKHYLHGSMPNPFRYKPKALVVIKMKKEGKEVADKMNEFDLKYTHRKDYDKFAIAINGESGIGGRKKFDKHDSFQVKEIKKYPVVIITQSMYLQVCKDKLLGQNLFGNRDILIVDEEVDFVYETFDSITISKISIIEEKYLKFSNLTQVTFKELVYDIRQSLANKYDQMKRVFLNKDTEWLNKISSELSYHINKAVDEKYIKMLSKKSPELAKEDDSPEDISKEIMRKINKLIKFYNDENVIAYRNGLYRYDPNIQPFMLKNNIWLDASANFNHLYELEKKLFIIKKSKREVDHSKCTLYFDCENKSTTSGKENYVDLEKDILGQIVKTVDVNDKILILDNKDQCRYISELIDTNDKFQKLKELNEKLKEIDDEAEAIDTVNYFAMRGRNIWGDYNKCYAIQQPQMIFPYYIFLYEYWTKEKLNDKEMYLSNYIDEELKNKTYGFTLPKTVGGEIITYTEEEIMRNKSLELLRQTTQAPSIYQGLKRIQRNTNPKGDFYVITTDKKIMKILIKQFKNINIQPFKFQIRYKNPSKASDTAVKRLNNWLNETEDNLLISNKKLAEICETTVDNLKKIIKRHVEIAEKIVRKKVLIYEFSIPIEYLAQAPACELYSVKEFEKKFNLIWKNFKRNKYTKKIIQKRNILINKGIFEIKV